MHLLLQSVREEVAQCASHEKKDEAVSKNQETFVKMFRSTRG